MTSALHGCEWSASRLCHFNPGTHWIGGGVLDTRAGLRGEGKTYSCWEWNSGRSASSPSIYRASYPVSSFQLFKLIYSYLACYPLLMEEGVDARYFHVLCLSFPSRTECLSPPLLPIYKEPVILPVQKKGDKTV
jgi:hypothetical protein